MPPLRHDFPGSLQCLRGCPFRLQSDVLVLSIFRGTDRTTPPEGRWLQTSVEELPVFSGLNPYWFWRSRLASPRIHFAFRHTPYTGVLGPVCLAWLLEWQVFASCFNFSAQLYPSVYYCKQLVCLLGGTGHPLAPGLKAGGTEELQGHMATLWSLLYLLSAMAFSLLRLPHCSPAALVCHYNNSTHVLFLLYDEYNLTISTTTKHWSCFWTHRKRLKTNWSPEIPVGFSHWLDVSLSIWQTISLISGGYN